MNRYNAGFQVKFLIFFIITLFTGVNAIYMDRFKVSFQILLQICFLFTLLIGASDISTNRYNVAGNIHFVSVERVKCNAVFFLKQFLKVYISRKFILTLWTILTIGTQKKTLKKLNNDGEPILLIYHFCRNTNSEGENS